MKDRMPKFWGFKWEAQRKTFKENTNYHPKSKPTEIDGKILKKSLKGTISNQKFLAIVEPHVQQFFAVLRVNTPLFIQHRRTAGGPIEIGHGNAVARGHGEAIFEVLRVKRNDPSMDRLK